MKAELFDNPFDTADTDRLTGLREFLSDDLWGCIGVEEAVANDLANDFVSASGIAFGAAWFAAEG